MVTTTFASPLGEILLAADARGLTGLWFEGQEHFGSTLLREDSEHVEGADAVSGTGGMSSVSPVPLLLWWRSTVWMPRAFTSL